MTRVAGMFLALTIMTTASAAAQERRMGMQPPPDHWITADSLVKALGVTDAKVKDAVAPHLAEVDKIMKTAAGERQKMREAMMGSGGMGGMSDSSRQAMMSKNDEWQKGLDAHLGAVRAALPEANRAAFDALQKPTMRMGGPRGRMGGGPPQ